MLESAHIMGKKLFLYLFISTTLGIGGGLLARGFTSSSDDYRVTGIVVPPESVANSIVTSNGVSNADPASGYHVNPKLENNDYYTNKSLLALESSAPHMLSSTLYLLSFGLMSILVITALAFWLISLRNKLKQEIRRREALEVELTIHKTLNQLRNAIQIQVGHLVEKAEHKAVAQQILDEFGTVDESLRKEVKDILEK